MQIRQRAAFVGGAALLLAIVAWIYFSPYIAIRAMTKAAEQRDAAALSEYVDYPALRESLKAALNAKLLEATNGARDGSPGAGLGAALGQAFGALLIGSFVDSVVSPESLALMLKGQPPKLDKQQRDAPADAKQEREVVNEYEAFDRFVVKARPKSAPEDKSIAMVFRRSGLASWKLTAIRLPQ